MVYFSDEKDTKPCAACKEASYRLVHEDASRDTYFIFEGVKLLVEEGVLTYHGHLETHPVKMYMCSKCGHADFYGGWSEVGQIPR
jgi:hypothetical protein